jgi:hypothetical protein
VDNKECLITILNAFEEINKDVKLILFWTVFATK